MKNNFILLISIMSIIGMHAQIAIGKEAPVSGAILDFGTDGNKGILLPWIITLNPSSVPGTLYFDSTDSKVKMLKANNEILDLSVKPVTETSPQNQSFINYPNFVESANINGVVLGANQSNTPGVLVLESQDEALVLPKTTDFNNVGAPEKGMIVYDSTKKFFCVYDGEKWAFWGKQL